MRSARPVFAALSLFLLCASVLPAAAFPGTERVTSNPERGTISALVWHDLDLDGRRQPGEPGISGVELELLDAGSAVVATGVTGADGRAPFQVAGGGYSVRVAQSSFAPGGALEKASGGTEGEASQPVFGFSLPGASVAGSVYQDVDEDGQPGTGEGRAGALLRLTGDTDGDGTEDLSVFAVTGSSGHFAFTGLAPGDYRLHVRWESFAAGGALQNLSQVADPDGFTDDGTAFILAADQHLPGRDLGYLRRPQPGVEKDNYWRGHPAQWPLTELTVGGVVYTRAEALDRMHPPGGAGDQSLVLFSEVVAARLNVARGNDADCILPTLDAADAWLVDHPPGSSVRPNQPVWRTEGRGLWQALRDYDQGKLCAPKGKGAVNLLPVAEDADLVTDENTAVAVPLAGHDPEGQVLAWTVVAGPDHGTLTGSAPILTYTPDAGFAGTDLVVVRADDGQDSSNAGWLRVTVEATNAAPLAQDDALTVTEGGAASLLDGGADSVLDNDSDPDGDALVATTTPVSGPSHGNLTLAADGTFSYVHDGSETVADTFVYEVCDDGVPLLCSTATVSVAVTPVNDPPVVAGESYLAAGNTQLAGGGVPATAAASVATPAGLLANDSDVDGPAPLAVVPFVGASAAGGDVVVNGDGTFLYEPPAGFAGSDSFAYQVTDGATVTPGTATVEVAEVVWYVDNTAAAGGDGRSTAPFDTLAAAESTSGAGQTVFVFTGDGTTAGQSAGFTLQDGQSLVGQGVDLVVDFGAGPTVLVVAGSPPAVTHGAGDAVSATAVVDVAVRGLRLTAPAGAGVALSGVTGAVLDRIAIENPGGAGVEAQQASGISFLEGSVEGGSVGLQLVDLGGTNLVQGADLEGAAGSLVELVNTDVDGSLAITATSFREAGNDGVLLVAAGSSEVMLSVDGSQFHDIAGESVQVNGGVAASGRVEASLTGNTVTVGAAGLGGGFSFSGQEQVTLAFTIDGNHFGPAAPSADAGPQGPGLLVADANDQSRVEGTITGNTVRNAAGSSGLVLFVDEDAVLRVVAEDNLFENVGSDGIQVANFCFGACAADLDLVLARNMVDGHSADAGFVGGFALFGGGGAGAGSGTCVAFDSNSITGTPGGFVDYYLDDFGSPGPIRVEGPTTDPVTAADVQSLNGQPGANVLLFGNVVFSGGLPCDRP